MTDSKSKNASPLVNAVLALDSSLAEMERLGTKICSLDVKSESDLGQLQRFMELFAQCGESVSSEVAHLSGQLLEARARAENVTQKVAARAEEFKGRKSAEMQKMDEFQVLANKVSLLNASIAELRPSEGESVSEQHREKVVAKLKNVQSQLDPLIEEAKAMRAEAHRAKMKTLEGNADSLAQTLQSVREKLKSLFSK